MRKFFARLVFGFALFIFLMIAGVTIISSVSDDSAYVLLLSRNRIVRVVKNYVFNSTQNKNHSSATSGAGLNLLLIEDLDDGYCKEMLTLFKDSADGKLDAHAAKVAVSALCGIQANETGFYSGTHLLKSYLPCDSKGVVTWKKAYKDIAADDMCLNRVDAGIYEKGLPNNGIDAGVAKTVFQFDNWNSSSDTKSKLNGATNEGRSGGDNKFLPDILTAVNYHYSTSLKAAKLDAFASSFDSMQTATFTSIQHNRGSGGVLQYAYGIRYGLMYNSYIDVNNKTSDDTVKALKHISDLYTKYKDSVLKADGSISPENFIQSDKCRYAAVFIAANTEDWFVSDYAVKYCSNAKGVEIWNDMFPDKTVKSADALRKELNKSNASLKEAIKQVNSTAVSDADIKKVYGTGNCYDDMKNMSSWGNCGSIFYVSKDTSSAYKHKYSDGKTPYMVSCYDIISAGHAVGASIGGEYVYAYMLKLGGLSSIDPTNPSTYNQQLETGTFVSSGDTSWMAAYNVPIDSLNAARINVLNTAYNLTQVGAFYELSGAAHSAAFSADFIPTKIECSGFVGKVFNNSGFTKAKNYATTAILNEQDIYKRIKRAEMKPADILCYDVAGGAQGHVLLYLSGTVSENCTLYTLESTSATGGIIVSSSNGTGPQLRTRTFSGDRSIESGKTQHNRHYFPLRASNIDSAGKKTVEWTAKGKKKK